MTGAEEVQQVRFLQNDLTKSKGIFFNYFFWLHETVTAAGSINEKMRFLAKKNARFSAPHM